MICLLHGYLLEGSGSNLWTRAMLSSLCRTGETVHLVCQENHPEIYDFIAEARAYHPDGHVETFLSRELDLPGRCILHKPVLGDTLPVYVRDRYEEFSRVVPMIELADEEIESYLRRNIDVVRRVVAENDIHALHANHAVLMPQVAQPVAEEAGVPFTIMPHGSAIEYAVKRDGRFHRRAAASFAAADRIFTIGPEIRTRVLDVFGDIPDLEDRMTDLNLGVDTRMFEPVDPARRAERIRELNRALATVERGRTAEDREALLRAVEELREGGRGRAGGRRGRGRRGSRGRGGAPAGLEVAVGADADSDVDLDALARLLAEPPGDPKRPDADVEVALAGIDWGREPVVLFVGRLIAAKGPQAVLAAFPEVLRRHADARLIVVGHGPLRPALEAMTHALIVGDRALFEAVIRLPLQGAPDGMPEVRAYLAALGDAGSADYFGNAAARMAPGRVVFTGYLKHTELQHLFPCCDAAAFPSLVREAGPLVFLEALSSGAVPLGTDFGGMAESLSAIESVVPADVMDAIRLSPRAEELVADLARGTPAAVAAAPELGPDLRRIAVERYDWTSVARRFSAELRSLSNR